MTEAILVIPSPNDIKESIEAEIKEEEQKASIYAKKLLTAAEIASLLMQNKKILYEGNSVTLYLKSTFSDLSAAGLELKALEKPIRALLAGYNVIIEENTRQSTLKLTISIPAEFFAPEKETENK